MKNKNEEPFLRDNLGRKFNPFTNKKIRITKKTKPFGIKLARKMKRLGYDDSDIVQETGYHI